MLINSFIGLTSCDNDDTPLLDIESETVTNLEAIQSSDYTVNPPAITGDYIKFSFASGTIVTGDNWDIAFRGTAILVNGGSPLQEQINQVEEQQQVYILLQVL